MNRSAAIRVPKYAVSPTAKRIEYRPPDFTCNIYLALASMLMAGLDGIGSKIDVAANDFGSFDVDIGKEDEAYRSRITALPGSLHQAMDALEADHGFLTKGEVFSTEFIRTWAAAKRLEHTAMVARRPHPYEYVLYLDT